MNIAIIGAGAAGCLCAIEIKRRHPEYEVDVYEAGTRALAKVAVTGGGRCNLTNSFRLVDDLRKVYPRGDKLMRKALSVFSHEDAMEWFEREGVRLVVQDDECVFPVSQDAMEIVNTLLSAMRRAGVRLHLRHRVEEITVEETSPFTLHFSPLMGESEGASRSSLFTLHSSLSVGHADTVIVTTGGHPRESGFAMLRNLDVKIESPVPSLFTFNIDGDWKQELMGTVVDPVQVTLCGTKMRSHGALLLTHWGMSGPAILKLSSYAARHLADNGYKGAIAINWLCKDEETVRREISDLYAANAQKFVTNVHPPQFTSRHWQVMLHRCSIPETLRCSAITPKHLNRLVTALTADTYTITGRCHFKEEFVTCGGVSLKSINPTTLESRKHPRLYFAGEVLDVDGITGGFNLQAAWSMAMTVANALT